MPTVDQMLTVAPNQSDVSTPSVHHDSLQPIDMATASAEPHQNDQDWWDNFAQSSASKTTQMEPVRFDWDKTHAQMFMNSPHSREVGFDPVLGDKEQEDKYQQYQTGWDELKRGTEGTAVAFGQGFTGMAKNLQNIGSVFSDPSLQNSFKQDQLDSLAKQQQDFEDNYHIFQGDNPTWASSIAKGFQSTGNFIGSLAEVAATTAAIQAIAAATGETAAPALDAINASQIEAFGATELSAGATPELIANTTKLVGNRILPEAIGNAWKNIGQIATEYADKLPLPGSATAGYLVGDLAQGGAGGAMATIGRGFGAFANDVNAINTATGFAQGNASATYQQIIADQTEKFRKSHGGEDPGYADQQDIADKAMKAAKVDGAINAYGMLFLEKAAFGNLLNSKATTEAYLERNSYKDIGIKPTSAEDAATAPLYIKQQYKWYEFKNQLLGNYAEGAKNLGLKGVEFGAFGNVIGGIDKSIKSYWDAKYDNKDISGLDAIREGIGSQFTKEGMGTFISGFVQGALVLGIGGAALGKGKDWAIDGVRRKYNEAGKTPEEIATNKQEAAEEQVKNNTQRDTFVNEMNDVWNDPLNKVKATFQGMVRQNMFAEAGKSALASNADIQDAKGFHDVKDDATREFLLKMAKNGLGDLWVKRMQEYSNTLSQDDITKMVGIASTPENRQAIQEQIAELPGRLKDLKRISKDVEQKLGTPYQPYAKDSLTGKRLYPNGSDEFKLQSKLKDIHDASKDMLVTMHDEAERKLIRQVDLLNGKGSSKGILGEPFAKNLDYSVVYRVTSPDLLSREQDLINQELAVTAGDAGKKAISDKKMSIKIYKDSLDRYIKDMKDIMDNPSGDSEQRKKAVRDKYRNELSQNLQNYLSESLKEVNIAGKVSQVRKPPTFQEVYSGIDKMMDYYDLGMEHDRMLDNLNLVLDPKIIKRYQMSFMNYGTYRQQEAKRTNDQKVAETLTKRNKAQSTIDKILSDLKEGKREATESETRKMEVQKKIVEDLNKQLTELGYKHPVEEADAEKDTPPPPDTNEDKVVERTPAELKSDKKAFLDIFTTDEDNDAEIPKGADGKKLHGDLIQTLVQLRGLYPEDKERYKESAIAINDYFSKLLNDSVDKGYHSNLYGTPEVEQDGEENGKPVYKVFVKGEAQGKGFFSIEQGNKELDRYVEKNHPLIPDTEYRIGQRLYDGINEVKVVEKGDKLYIKPFKEATANLDEQTDAGYITEHLTPTPVERPTDKPGYTPFDSTQPKSSDPNAIVNVAPNKAGGVGSVLTEEDKVAFRNAILSIPEQDIREGRGVSLKVTDAGEQKGFIKDPIPGNSQIKQYKQRFAIAIVHDGVTVGYLTSAGQLYKALDGSLKTVQQLTLADVAALYKPTAQFPTAQMWLDHLIRTDADNQRLQDMAKSGSIPDGAVVFTPHYQLDHIGTDEDGAKVAELEGVQHGEHGIKMYVVNNIEPEIPEDIQEQLNSRGDNDNNIVEWTGVQSSDIIQNTFTDLGEMNQATKIAKNPIGQTSMYTAVVQLANGKMLPIQLIPRQMRVDEQEQFVDAISDVDNNDKLGKANAELKKLFISLPVYSEEHADKKGISLHLMSFGTGSLNKINVRIVQKIGKESVQIGEGNIEKKKGEDTLILEDTDQFLKELNKVIKATNTGLLDITEKNLKYQPSADNLSDMEANVHKNIVRSVGLTYSVPDTGGVKRVIQDEVVIPQTPISENVPHETSDEQSPEDELKQLQQEVKIKKRGRPKKNTVPKLLDATFDAKAVENIDTFKDFVATNLPTSITVGELENVAINLKTGRVRVGQFVTYLNDLGNVAGRIETTPGAPYKFHEAMHGIFRLLLTPEQQKEQIAYADKVNPVTAKKLAEFKASDDRYSNMSEEELHNEYQEEFIADEFDKYSTDKSSSKATSGMRAFFNRIWDWIRFAYDKLTGNRMRALFYQVHAGDFRNAGLQENDFTRDFSVTDPVPKNIQTGWDEENGRDTYLPSQKAAQITGDITAMVMLDMKDNKYPSFNKAIEGAMDKYRDTYDPLSQRNIDRYKAIPNTAARKSWGKQLAEMHNVFDDNDNRIQLKESVVNNLRINGIKDAIDREEYEDDIDEVGPRNADNRFKNSASIGGYESIGAGIRRYIATNHINLQDTGKTDELGFDTHADGTPMIQAADTNYIYNGLLKLLSGSSDAGKVLNRIDTYINSGNNPDTIKFLQNWIQETGFNIDKFRDTGLVECSTEQGANLFNEVMKGFMQIPYNYINTIINPNTGEAYIVNASSENAEKNQFRQWSNAFQAKYWNQIEEQKNNIERDRIYKAATEPLQRLVNETKTITAKNRQISDQALAVLSTGISRDLYNSTGINWHPDYINYSIVAGKEEKVRTDMQNRFMQANRIAKPIDVEDMRKSFLDHLKRPTNPFIRPEGSTEAGIPEKWLLATAKENARFDQSVNSMSHTNAKGDTIFDYGYRSYVADAVESLNDPETITKKITDVDTKGSFLLYSPEFAAIDKELQLVGALSLKETVNDKETGEYDIKSSDIRKEGTDFSDFSGREYMVYNLSQYDINRISGAIKETPEGKTFAVTNISLGPIAEKNSHHMIALPVIKGVEKTGTGWKTSDEAKSILFNEVKDETDRIRRVQQEIEEGQQNGKEWIEGYHTGDKRGIKLWKTDLLLDHVIGDDEQTIGKTIEQAVIQEGFDIEQYRDKIYKAIDRSMRSDVIDLRSRLIDEGLMTRDNKNILLPRYLFKGLDKLKNDVMNLKAGDFDHNLAQVYVNSYVNYMGLIHLIYGDEAKRAKNFTELWKRRAGIGAQGPGVNNIADVPSTETIPVDKVYHVTYPDDTDKGVKAVDDGQMYQTVKGARSFLLGLGKMTEFKRAILDKLEAGKPLSIKEQQEMLKTKSVINPMKLMFDDGKTYLKCSSMTLLREDTSYRSGNKWLPLPEREINHEKLNKADEQQDGYDSATDSYRNNIVVMHPVSVSKGVKDTVAPSVQGIEDHHWLPLDSKNLRLQVENPSKGGDNKQAKPVQPAYQILSGQDTSKPVYVNGEWKKAGDVIHDYMNAVEQRKKNNAIAAISEIFDSKIPITDLEKLPDLVPNMDKFMDKSVDTLMATGADSQTIEFYAKHFNINLPPLVDKGTSILLSHFIKGVTKENVPLWSMTIISDSGFSVIRQVTHVDADGQPIYSKCPIVPMKEFKRHPEQYSTVHDYKRTADDRFEGLTEHLDTGKPLYIADILRDVIPAYDSNDKVTHYYTEGLRPYQTDDEIANDKFAAPLSEGLGARIPGTDKHSYTRIKWVDSIATAHGNSCVLSRFLMNRDGHDNDLDKFQTQVFSTYRKGTDRIAYGAVSDDKSKFEEYKQYQLDNNQEVQKLYHGDKLYSGAEFVASILEDDTVDAYRVEQVLKELRLPSTVDEFVKRGGDNLNNGVQTNNALHAQIALLSGDHVSGGGQDAIINQATSTDAVKQQADELVQYLQEPVDREVSEGAQLLADQLSDKQKDINGMLGQMTAYEMSKGGSQEVGAVANIIQVGSVLNQFGVKITGVPYTFDGKTFDNYSTNKTLSGRYVGQEMDTLAQMILDGIKDHLNTRFGLNVEYTGYLANMIRLGQDLDTALLYPLTDPWIEYAKRVATGKGNYRIGYTESATTILKDMKQKMISKGAKGTTLTQNKMKEYLRSGKQDIDVELSLLDDLEILKDLHEPLRAISKIMTLDTGRSISSLKDIADIQKAYDNLGVGMNKERFDKSGIPIDVRNVVTKGHGNMAANYQMFKAMRDNLLPKFLLAATDTVKAIENRIMGNFTPITAADPNVGKQLTQDVISYLSLIPYINNLPVDERATLNQNLIWDNSDSDKSIVAIVRNLRTLLKGKDSNYALNAFLNIIEKGKGTQVNQLMANSWSRMSEQQQVKVVGAIVDMVASSDNGIHKGAMALFHYLLVKDGGQFKGGSFIRYIPTFMMQDWSDSMSKTVKFLSETDKKDDKAFMEMFGKTYSDLTEGFMDAYMSNVANQRYIRDVNKQPLEHYQDGSTEAPEWIRKGNSLMKADYTGEHPEYNVVPVDGDYKQWKAAKGVFGDYPTEQEPSALPIKEQKVIQADVKEGVYTANIGGKEVQINKSGDVIKSQSDVVSSTSMQSQLFQKPLPTPAEIAKLPVIPNKYKDGGQSIDGIQMLSKVPGDTAYKAIQRGDRTESTRSANQFSKPKTGSYEVITGPNGERGLIQVTHDPYTPNKQTFDQYEGWAPGQWERSSSRFTDKWFSYRFKYLGEIDKNNNLTESVVPSQQMGDNISSNSKGLAAALTNPTELAKRKGNLTQSYPIDYKGKSYPDIESAYQANKAPYLKTKTTGVLMTDLITNKLQTYPQLVKGIKDKGGMNYLEKSTHKITGDNYWETGEGKSDGFMTALKQAYRNVTEIVPSQPVSNMEKLYIKAENRVRKAFDDLPKLHSIGEGEGIDNFHFMEGGDKLVAIDSVYLPEKYRGQGLGLSLYIIRGEELLQVGKILINQDGMSSDAWKIWHRLHDLGLASQTGKHATFEYVGLKGLNELALNENLKQKGIGQPVTDWKSTIDQIATEKGITADKKSEWLDEARAVYKSLVGKIPDNEIIDKIKSCI